jgi:hypothetical protein
VDRKNSNEYVLLTFQISYGSVFSCYTARLLIAGAEGDTCLTCHRRVQVLDWSDLAHEMQKLQLQ